jgi:hypothetical protein
MFCWYLYSDDITRVIIINTIIRWKLGIQLVMYDCLEFAKFILYGS